MIRTSGHVDRFTDFMVYDEKTRDPYRADKLLEGNLNQVTVQIVATDH